MIRPVAVLALAAMISALPAPLEAAPKGGKRKEKPPSAGSQPAREAPVPARPPSPAPAAPAPGQADAEAGKSAGSKVPLPAAAPASPPPAEHGPDPVAKAGAEAAAARGDDAEYNRRLVPLAIRMGILGKGAGPADMTPEVMNRMIDAHVMRDAIRAGLLPANAVPSQVTAEIRAAMRKGGFFVHYFPDGSVNPNYGGK